MSFRLIELRKCYDMIGERIRKNVRKAEMQNKIIGFLQKLSRLKSGIPLTIFIRIYKLESEMKKEKIDRRRTKLPEVTSYGTVIPHADSPKSPFFEIVAVLKSDTITSEGIFNVKIPNRFLPQLRKKKSGRYSYDVQLLFIDKGNTRWNSPTISYQVNDGAEQEMLRSPPIIYITGYCTLGKKARNVIKVTFPDTVQEFKVIISVVKRLDPSNLVVVHPVVKVSKTEELLRKKCEEENVYVCQILLVNPDDDGDDKTITLPCRSSFCNHPEVFDLMHFLEKMQYFIKWYCPVCSKPVTYESLEVDTSGFDGGFLYALCDIIDYLFILIVSFGLYFAPYIQRGIVFFTFYKKKEIKNVADKEVLFTEDIIFLD